MFGWGPFPRLGAAGAAAGASVASAFAAALHARALRRSCGVSLEWAPPNLSEIAGMVRVGLPLASNGVVFTLVYIAIGRVASGCGEQNLAALGLGQKFEAVAFTVIEGFRLACATLVGQWVGAGKPRRARNAAAVSVALCVAAMAPFVAALFSLGPTLAGSVGADPATAAAAGSYLRWNSGALLFLALEAVTEGAFTGAGNTVPVLVVGTLCNLARVPAAHYLAFAAGWGVEGVWAAIVASQILKGLLKSWWFRTRVMTDLERKAGAGKTTRTRADREGSSVWRGETRGETNETARGFGAGVATVSHRHISHKILVQHRRLSRDVPTPLFVQRPPPRTCRARAHREVSGLGFKIRLNLRLPSLRGRVGWERARERRKGD